MSSIAPDARPAPRVRFDRVSKRFPGVLALDAVSFGIAPGCIHALVGENGAGKSTLMKILAGAQPPDDGTILLDGEPAAIRDARHAQQLGVAIVYQEFNLAEDLTVSENVYLGRWPRRRWSGLIRYGELHARTQRLFSGLALDVPVRARVASLSVAQQQMVEIGKALSLDARVLVLDEPSAVLTPHELAALFRLVRDLAARGVSIIYISHRLDEIFVLADVVTVLRDGRHISTRPIGAVTREGLIRETVGRSLEQEFPRRSRAAAPVRRRPSEPRLSSRELDGPRGGSPRPDHESGDPVLVVNGLSGGPFRDVSFDIRAGEVFALTGLVGSGRSSVAKAIFGAMPVTSGDVAVAPQRTARRCFRTPREAMRAGIALLPEDRKREGLLLERPLRENVTLPHREDAASWGLLLPRRERPLAAALMARHGVKAASTEVPAATLSGGNQQKAMLARWLARPYRVVILDEPTRGVDVGAKVEIYEKLNRIADSGAAVLMISSELPEVIGMADRIGVMCEGRLMGVLENGGRNVSQEAIMELAVGGVENSEWRIANNE